MSSSDNMNANAINRKKHKPTSLRRRPPSHAPKSTIARSLSTALLGVILASIGLTTYASTMWVARGLDDASTYDTFFPVVGIMSLLVVIGTALTLSGIAVTATGVIDSLDAIAIKAARSCN